MSKKSKLLISFLIIFAIFGGIVAYLIKISSQTLIDNAFDDAKEHLLHQSQIVNLFLGGFRNDVIFLSKTHAVQGIIRAKDNNGFDPEENWTYEEWADHLTSVFEEFALAKKFYQQLRYIDEDGNEVARVNYRSGQAELVPAEKLGNKKDRYYFTETMKLQQGALYISDLDLNREGNPPQIGIPYQPVIRYATPIFDVNNNQRGILIGNIFGNPFLSILQHFSDLHDGKKGSLFLLDQDGYYLSNYQKNKEWGGPRDLDTGENIKKDYPVLADQILSGKSDVVAYNSEVISYAPIVLNKREPEKFWVILRIVPQSEFLTPIDSLRNNLLIVSLVVLALAIGFVRFSAKKVAKKENE